MFFASLYYVFVKKSVRGACCGMQNGIPQGVSNLKLYL